MNILSNTISFDKYYILTSIMNNNKDSRLFNYLDSEIVKKRFDITAELSLTENILHISTYKLTGKNIIKIINDFIKSTEKMNFLEKRNLFELVKITALPADKLEKIIPSELHLALAKLFSNVSRETNFLSFDFLILKIMDNLILKNNDANVKKAYTKVKKNIIDKLLCEPYYEEKNEKETTLLCWVDRLLYAIINEEIPPTGFVSLAKKIFRLTTKSLYLQWKVLHSVNYILLQKEFSTSSDLKVFKRELIKSIKNQYDYTNFTLEEVENLVVSTLARKNSCKEDFYYLFDVIRLTSQKSENNRFYCLMLCKYIINHNSKQNIFCFRFIRKYFIEMLFEIINKPKESLKIKEEELEVLITLFHVDSYFCFYRHDIFNKIVNILKSINNGKTKLSNANFYRFCDVLDYIMNENPDMFDENIIKDLSRKDDDEIKIKKYFSLAFG